MRVDDFRFRAIWQWNPVSCLSPRSYDEKYMLAHDDWFFDRSFMQRYFTAMTEAGLNTWILANTHPFPFMVDLGAFPDAVVLSAAALSRYQAHYHWLFETARARGIQPFVMFHTCYVPDAFGNKHDIRPMHAYEPPQLAYDYTRHCVRQLCATYPELAGINGEASENVATHLRDRFARDAIVAGIHDAEERPILFFRGWISDPAGMKAQVLDAYRGETFFTVKYTWEFLTQPQPDPEFRRWIDACGSAHVLPEFWISNYQPFGCHDTELAAGLHQQISDLGCPGFTSHPMDLYGAPFVQGTERRVLQLDRDRDWFGTLAGLDLGADNGAVARAACRPSQRIAHFVTGNKQNFHQPQWLAAIGGDASRRAGLFGFHHWRNLPAQIEASYGRWLPQIDQVEVRYPTESGPGFDLADLLAELAELDAEWQQPAACPGDPVYTAWCRDLCALRNMARAWAARGRAVLAHFNDDHEAVVSALQDSLELVARMPDISGCDGPFRLLVGRHTLILHWSDLAAALAREITDYRQGTVAEYSFFGAAEHYDIT